MLNISVLQGQLDCMGEIFIQQKFWLYSVIALSALLTAYMYIVLTRLLVVLSNTIMLDVAYNAVYRCTLFNLLNAILISYSGKL